VIFLIDVSSEQIMETSILNDILGELCDIKGLLQQIANDTSRIP